MDIEQLKNDIEEIKNWKKSLEASHSIPLNIDQAFRARLSGIGSVLSTSSKGATTENRTVDEAGVATYDVLKPPDAFLQININSTIYYIPVFT